MSKNSWILFILCLLIFSCSKKDVFESDKQLLIKPIAKCENGLAGEYPCKDYDLLTYISLEELGSLDTKGNDSWGWVDPETQKEYALMCTNQGTTFIDITDPANAIILGTLKTQTVNSPWRDVKVFNSFAYVVSEAENHGMQIFNLTRLRNVVNPPVEFDVDFQYSKFTNAHNIVINEDSAFAYVVGSDTFNGGPHFIDIQQPFNPKASNGYAEEAYSHDAQVVSYKGPDSDYTDKEILIGSNENEVVIVDVTDKESPIKIASINYPNIGYVHQGWFTEDQRYFILGDELDEIRFGGNSRTIIFDFTDLDNPKYHMEYFGTTPAIDHNGYVKGSTYFQANYAAGVRMIDISNIENKILNEIGFFDTYPENNNAAFKGAWSVYPYLPSGNIIISDIDRGLFVIRKSKN
jgi:choice-of-anchor B domain-containing protein